MIIYQEDIRRIGVKVTSGRYTLEDDQWFEHQDEGAKMPIDDPRRPARPVAATTDDDLNGTEPAVDIPPKGGE